MSERAVSLQPLHGGRFTGEGIAMADFAISAHCNRVPTLDGHLECVSVALRSKATPEEAANDKSAQSSDKKE